MTFLTTRVREISTRTDPGLFGLEQPIRPLTETTMAANVMDLIIIMSYWRHILILQWPP